MHLAKVIDISTRRKVEASDADLQAELRAIMASLAELDEMMRGIE